MCLKPTLATLTVLATALPFLFPYTQPPSTGFWPLMFTALCGWVLAVVVWCSGRELAGRASTRSVPRDQVRASYLVEIDRVLRVHTYKLLHAPVYFYQSLYIIVGE